MPTETVLLIEDDPAIVSGLELNLSLEGYEVLSASDGETGFRVACDREPDLVVLDIMLPGMNGLEVLRRLRERSPETPVLILSARGEEADKVLGLQLGADDYLSKPFSLSELLARINAALRRQRLQAQQPSKLSVGDVQIDLDRRVVSRDGREIVMTAREFELLTYFVSHPGIALSRERLLDAVWRMDYLTHRTIDNFVGRLRAKLEPDPDNPRHFLTVRGVGYRFEP
jgi:two-component system, OmpR family, alkaline phosphatase synthesis response regulator PhoP